MTTNTALTPALADKLNRQLEQWRKSLVALDRRQRLLYFKHTRSSSFELAPPGAGEVARLLGRGSAFLYARVDDADGSSEESAIMLPERMLEQGLEVAGKTPAEVTRGLRRLDQVSKQTYADRGLWTLYLGLGMLEWVDPEDGKPVLSPLVLLPVELSRAGKDQPYEIARTEDDPVFNPALRLKLEDFALVLPDVDVDDVDVVGTMRRVDELVRGRPGWAVRDRTVLTTFSFHKEAMFRDLGDNHDEVVASPLVQLLALGPDSPTAETLPFDPIAEGTLDDEFPPEELVSILDADGTQRRCILAAKGGRSFVMDGPPGTGKSQTIANMIVELMADGKTVLFVSEKAAALDVVRNRMAAAGLQQFLLELHSHAATRKNIVHDLYTALTTQVRVSGLLREHEFNSLGDARRELTAYARAVNEVRQPLGSSIVHVLGLLVGEAPAVAVDLPRDKEWTRFTSGNLTDLRSHTRRLSNCWRPVTEGDQFLWSGLARTDLDDSEAKRMRDLASHASRRAAELVERARAVDGDLGLALPMTTAEIQRRLAVLALAERHPGAPVHWLTMEELRWVHALMDNRESEVAALLQDRAALAEDVGSRSDELDLSLRSTPTSAVRTAWAPSADTPRSSVKPVHAFLTAAPGRLAGMLDDARRLASLLGMPESGVTAARARTYARMAALGTATERPEAVWLNPSIQDAVAESIRVLGPLTEVVRQRETAMREVFTEAALELDLGSLHLRFRDSHTGLAKFGSAARADKKALKVVTRAGKVDKAVLARLEEAAAWQAAHHNLTQSEGRYASRLGTSYQRLDTDFNRIAGALEVAHQAIALAGADLDSTRLAPQLAVDSTPDPALVPLAARITSALESWELATRSLFTQQDSDRLLSMPLGVASTWCERAAAAVADQLVVLDHVCEVSGRDVDYRSAIRVLDSAAGVAAGSAALEVTRDMDSAQLGAGYQGEHTDWSALRAGLRWSEDVRTLMSGPLAPVTATNLRSLSITTEMVAERLHSWEHVRDEVTSLFSAARSREVAAELAGDLTTAASYLDDLAATAVRDIDEWCQLEAERQWLRERKLGPVLTAVERARLPSTSVAACFEQAALHAWLNEVMRGDERLARYRAKERDALVEEFRQLDKQLVQESHAVVAQRCAARRPKSLRSHAAQVITREAQKKTRHKPIRTLLSETAELVQELKPCFMMSPLSVSQYLPPGLRFDVVIFDEASQVLPSDAVNCVYRGDQLIVAGDQKQLPPTAFFASVDDEADVDDDNADLDSFQSVLDLAKGAGGLTSLPLSWHYRSQHESLITYSNYRFYNGSLYTFPGAVFDAPDLGVELILVDGQYRRGGARDNPIEADKVAERVAHHLHEHPALSLGVVTFSTSQEDAVLAALDRRALDDPALAALLADHDRLDGFFVKNLENVQGDERDVIFFSLGYGPDEHGKLTMNFGPLNREGGWRRLNVAITRARRRVEVVSSFRAHQMSETQSEGVRHLRGYLDFADRGQVALATETPDSMGDAESVFEEEVLQVIRSWGYEVVPQVGAAGYRIDMAIRHPDRPGQYVLAVECDGAAYHSAKTARDRDRLREAVLVGLGWNVHRIWGISWWRDRAVQMTRLRNAIDDAIAQSDGAERPVVEDVRASRTVVEFDEVDFDVAPDWAVPYRPAPVQPVENYDPKSLDALPALRVFFARVLVVEAPMHESLLMQRFSATWGVGRMGHLIKANVDTALTKVTVGGAAVSRDGFGFYRVAGAPAVVVRVPDEGALVRSVLQVPSDELELAALNLIRDAVLADRDGTVQAVARLFGWRRMGAEIQNAVASAVSRLENRGDVEVTTGGMLRAADR